MENEQIVEVTVRVYLTEDADVQEAIAEMDYEFTHDNIIGTEIVALNTEL
jgi:hypothetical protein